MSQFVTSKNAPRTVITTSFAVNIIVNLMKKILLLLLLLNGFSKLFAQNPEIQGDVMLCPYTNGTATVTNPIYDSYQWYTKYWFSPDEYQPIQGATSSSFTYDWYNYDQSLFKVVVTLGTATLESNVIQIDSYNWSNLIVISELNETVTSNLDNGNLMLCPGGSFTNTISSPYTTNIQWFKDETPITGANQSTYVITEAGSYYVQGAPSYCPNSINSNQTQPIIVEMNLNCNLSTNPIKTLKEAIRIYPNPVTSNLSLEINNLVNVSKYSISDTTGKLIIESNASLENNATIDVSSLSNGLYFLKLESNMGNLIQKFIKE